MGISNMDDSSNDETLYQLADLFKVFGDPTRIRILAILSKQELCVQDIADALNVSRYYLSHEFKKSTGYGLWNYVISKRLVYSQKLLAEGASVTEACYESGFKDYAHFIKSFTKTFGCSPKQYGKSDDSIYMVKLNL